MPTSFRVIKRIPTFLVLLLATTALAIFAQTLVIFAQAAAAPQITSGDSVTFSVGVTGMFTITFTGSPAITERGALPRGVSFTDNGDGTATIAGTPALGSAGSYPITISASNGIQPDVQENFVLTISEIAMNGQFIYAAHNDGTITVHDINNSHSLVKTINVFSVAGADLRGAAAAMPTALFYVFYNVNQEGHIACVDLSNDFLVWDQIVHTPGVDRGDVTRDGQKLYVPTWEDDPNSPYELVLDAGTGNLLSTIAMPSRTHDTLCSLDGTRVFMENKNGMDRRVRVVSPVNDAVVSATDQFSGVVQPYAVTADNRFLIANVTGTYGFQYADLATGRIVGTAPFVGTTYNGSWPHGIGMTPDQHEAWVCDRGPGNHFVHVFDITSIPPQQTHLIALPYDNPTWLTFNIDGRYCYVTGPKILDQATTIVSTSTYQMIGALPTSQELLEVDFTDGRMTGVGSQFGVGRNPTATPPPFPSPTPTPADLKVTVTDSKTSVTAGLKDTYTIKVTNAGPNNVTGAAVVDNFPAIFTAVTFTATGANGASGFTASGTGNINDKVTLPATSSVTYKATGKVSSSASGTLSDTATVTPPSGANDPNSANNSATDIDTITNKADLKITVNDNKATAVAGQKNTYTIVATNMGPSNVAGAVISDSFPSTFNGVTYTATQTGGASGFAASGSGNISSTVTMPPASSITYKATGTISASATSSISDTATVTPPAGATDPNTTNNTATDTDTL
jgi:uncharacterized repeat protein (TIGR01451 family)